MARTALTKDVLAFASIAACLCAACGRDSPQPPAEADLTGPDAVAAGDAAGVYEHHFVFASVTGDSTFLVPWLITASATPDGVERAATGWLARDGVWEAFYDERWTTPPSRAPNRVLPHGSVSFTVRDGDAIDGIVFEEGPRNLELSLGEVAATWVGPRAETVEILEGAALLFDQRVEGAVLDMVRAAPGGSVPGGDWAFLLSGDSARFVLMADEEHDGETDPVYRGWGVANGSDLQWTELYVDWERTQAFPPSRRDVPVAWRVWASDGALEGELRVASADIRAGTGPGPLLPVLALFDVVGDIMTEQGSFAVRGLLVHQRR